ncbi:bifunctional fucokinase fucose pyrophosphorylase, partial [Olea europaea subsp. europaea]
EVRSIQDGPVAIVLIAASPEQVELYNWLLCAKCMGRIVPSTITITVPTPMASALAHMPPLSMPFLPLQTATLNAILALANTSMNLIRLNVLKL